MNRKPDGDLCKIQFKKTITIIAVVTYDDETKKFLVEGFSGGKPVTSWIDPNNVELIEEANDNEKRKYERYESPL